MKCFKEIGVHEWLFGATIGAYVVYSAVYFSKVYVAQIDNSVLSGGTNIEDKVKGELYESLGRGSLDFLCEDTMCPMPFLSK